MPDKSLFETYHFNMYREYVGRLLQYQMRNGYPPKKLTFYGMVEQLYRPEEAVLAAASPATKIIGQTRGQQ